MNKIITQNSTGKIIYLMVFFSTFVFFKVGNITWFTILQLLLCVYKVLEKRKLPLASTWEINLIYGELILATLVGAVFNPILSYKKSAMFMGGMSFLTYFTCLYINEQVKKISYTVRLIRDAFKAMALVQVVWVPIQYVVHLVSGLDINNLVFVNLLHFTEDASFVRAWEWFPAGCCHHPAVIAPMFVIAYCLFDSLPIKLLIIFDSLICGSSTAFVGVFVTALLLFFNRLFKKKKGLKRKQLIIAGIVIIVSVLVIAQTNVWTAITQRIFYLYARTSGISKDSSTSAHFQYYLDYLEIVKRSNIFQILFGCGEGCSGMWASQMYGRYSTLGNWAIECDIVNILVNRGIVGFTLFYLFMFRMIIKGWKINKCYSIVTIAIFIQGFGYNVQWEYITLMEIVFYYCICNKIDFFMD